MLAEGRLRKHGYNGALTVETLNNEETCGDRDMTLSDGKAFAAMIM